MDIIEAIRQRRSIKSFTPRPVGREEMERLLDAACQAPNHRMTEPWRFYVLGPEAREAYGRALGHRKARRVQEPDAAAAVVEKVAASHRDLPAMLAVAVVVDEDPEVAREDFSAAWMAVQNLCLAALDMGLGTHIKTGAVMDDPAARAALDVPDDQEVVALVHLGEPADVPDARPRTTADALTRWLS